MVLLLLGACSLCQPLAWQDVAQTEDDGIDTETADAIWRVWDEFVAWSGRENSCVHEVHLRSDYELVSEGVGAGGSFRHWGGRVEVSTALDDPEASLVHELCHAVDEQDGLSDAAPELFPRGEVELLDGSLATSGEVFALQCEGGAREVDRWRVVEDDCGLQLTDQDLDAQGSIQDTVYMDAPRLPWLVAGEQASAGTPWARAQATDALGRGELLASPHYLVRLRRTEDGDTQGSAGRMLVEHLDPQLGSVRAAVELQACGEGAVDCWVMSLPGPSGPWLWSYGGAESYTVRLWQLEPGQAEETPTTCGWQQPQLVAEGAVWMLSFRLETRSANSWATDVQLLGCDAETGEEFALDLPQPAFPLLGRRLTYAEPHLVTVGEQAAVWWEDAGLSWRSATDQAWSELELPPHLELRSPAPLASGSLLFPVLSTDPDSGVQVLHLARVGPDVGALGTVDTACLEVSGDQGYDWELLAGEGWAAVVEPDQVRPLLLH